MADELVCTSHHSHVVEPWNRDGWADETGGVVVYQADDLGEARQPLLLLRNSVEVRIYCAALMAVSNSEEAEVPL